MSKTIDSKIVEMRFDNKQFESAVSQSLLTLDKLKSKLNFKDLASSINTDALVRSINGIGNSVDNISSKFSAMGVAAATVISNLTSGFMNAGTQLVKSLSVDQVLTGWQKYERLMESTQMMMSATRSDIGTVWADREEQMDYINDKIETLMWYTDETSYDFADMADNIGKFTANGVKLDDAVTAMIGVSNWAGISGANVGQAARAMYNLSQALAMGSVRIQDWMSIENANMATAEFKQHVIDIARELPKSAEIIKDVENDIGEITAQNFRTTLSAGWFNTEVLTEVLKEYGQFSIDLKKAVDNTGLTATEYIGYIQDLKDGTMSLEDIQKEINKEDDYVNASAAVAWIEKLAGAYYETGFAAMVASQQSKTFKDSVNATKDAVSSKWTDIFTTVMGDYLESVELWSTVSEEMYNIFVADLDNLNRLLDAWGDLGGRERLLSIIENVYYTISGFISNLREGFATFFPETSAKQLYNAIDWIAKAVDEFTYANFTTQWTFSNGMDSAMKIGEEIGKIAGDIKRAFQYIGSAASNAWKEIFPGDPLFAKHLLEDIADAIESVRLKFDEFARSLQAKEKLESTFKGLFAILDILKQLAEAILRPIIGLFSSLDPNIEGLMGTILNFTGSVGDSIVALDNWIRDTDYFGKVVDQVIEYLKLVPGVVDDLVFQVTGYHIMDYVNSFLDRCQDIPGIFMTLGEKIKTQGLFPTIVEVIDYISDIPRKLIKTIEEMTGLELMPQYDTFVSKLKGIFSSLNSLIAFLSGIPARINQACLDYLGYSVPEILGGVLLFIISLPEKINDVLVELTGLGISDWFEVLAEKIKQAFDNVKEFLEGLKTYTDDDGNLVHYDTVLEGIVARIKDIRDGAEETIGKIKKLFGVEEETVTVDQSPTFLDAIGEKASDARDSLNDFKASIDGVLDAMNGDKEAETPLEKALTGIKKAADKVKGSFDWLTGSKKKSEEKDEDGGLLDKFKIDDPDRAIENLKSVAVVVGTIGGIFSAITVASGLLSKSIDKNDKNKPSPLERAALLIEGANSPIYAILSGFKKTNEAIISIGSAASAISSIVKFGVLLGVIISLSKAIVEIANVPESSLKLSLGVITAIIAEITTVILLSKKMGDASSLNGIAKCFSSMGIMFIALAASLAIVKKFGGSPDEMQSNMNILLSMLTGAATVLTLMMMLANTKTSSPEKIKSIAEAISIMSASLIIIGGAMIVMAAFQSTGASTTEAILGLTIPLLALGVVALEMNKLSKKTKKPEDLMAIASSIDIMAAALLIVAGAYLMMAPIADGSASSWVRLSQAFVALMLPLGGLAAMATYMIHVANDKIKGNGDDIVKVAAAIDLMAGALVIVAGAYLMMAPIANGSASSWVRLSQAFVALMLPLGGLAAMAVAFTGMAKKMKGRSEDILKVAASIDIMAAALIIVATAFLMLIPITSGGSSDWVRIGKAMTILLVPLAALSAVAIALMAISGKFGNANGNTILKVAASIDVMAAALIIIATSFLMLIPITSGGSDDWVRIGKAMTILLVPLAALAAVAIALMAISGKFGKANGDTILKVAASIDVMAAALVIIGASFLMLIPITSGGSSDWVRIGKAMTILLAPLAALAAVAIALMAISGKFDKANGDTILKVAASIDIMAAALAIIGASFLMLIPLTSGGSEDWVRIGKAMTILLVPLGGLAAVAVWMMSISGKFGKANGDTILKVAASIDVMAASLLIIAGAFMMLMPMVSGDNAASWPQITKVLGILLVPLLLLGTIAVEMMKVGKDIGGKGNDFLKIAAAIDLMAASLLIISGSIILLNKFGGDNQLVTGGILMAFLLALGGIMATFLSLGKNSNASEFTKIGIAFDLMAAALVIIAGAFVVLDQVGGSVNSLISEAEMLGGLFLELALTMAAFMFIGKDADGKKMLEIAGAMDLMSVAMIAIAGALAILQQYGGVANLTSQMIALGVLFGETAAVFALLSLISVDANKMIALAAAMDLLSVSFIALAGACAIIANNLTGWDNMWQTLILLAGAGTILAALSLAIAGAGTIAQSASVGISSLALALVALGVAATGIGLGFFLIVEGIEKLSALGDISASVNANGAAVGGLVGFFDQMPAAAASATKSLDSFANEWDVNGEQIKSATMTIINGIFDILESVILTRIDRTLAIIGQVIDKLLAFVGQYGPKFVLLVNNLFASLKAAWPAFEAWLTTVVGGILNIIDANKDKALVMFYNIGQSIVSKLRLLWPNLKGLISEFATGILEVIRDAIPLFGDIVSETFGILIDAIIENWPLLEQLLDMMLTTLLGDGTEENMGILQKFREPIKNLILGLLQDAIDGITESSAMIVESIITVVLGLLDALIENIGPITTKTFEIAFELIKGVLDSFTEENIKELAESGINFVLGIVNGIADATESKAEDIRAAMEHVVEVMVNSFCTILGIESPYKTGTASSTGNLFLDAGTNIMLGLIDGVSNSQGDVEKCIETIGQALIDAFKKKLGIHSPSKEFEDNGTNVIQGLIDGLEGEDILSDLEDAIKSAASKLFESFCKKLGIDPKNVSKGATEMLNAGKSAITGVIDGIEAKIVGLKQEISSAAAKVKEVFIGKSPDFEDSGYYVIEGIRKGINKYASRVTSVISGLATSAVSRFKEVLGIESPSKVFAELGQYVDMGFVEGLKNNAGDIFETTDWLGEESINEFTGIIDKISDFMDSNLDSAPTITPVLDLSEFSDGLGDMNGLMTSNSSWNIDAEQTSALASKATDYLTTHDLSDPTALFNDLKSTFTNMFKDKIGTTNVTFNVTGDNPKEIAEEIEHIIQDKIIKKESVWE